MSTILLSASDDPIDICYDNVFKAVFTKETPKSRGALSKLLSAVVRTEVSVIEIAVNEPAIDNQKDRNIRFDLHCREIGSGKLFDAEMSLDPDRVEPLRLEFYAGKLFTGQDISGVDKTYDDLKEAYQIAFLVKRRFFKDDDFFHEFEYYDPKRNMSLGGRSRVITLELAKIKGIEGRPVNEMSASERWGFYLKYLTDKGQREKINAIIASEEGIAMASEVLMTISRDEAERARLLSEYKYVVDTQSKVVQARREGEQRGLRKGRQEGRREGRQDGLRETARKMKERNVNWDQIADYTGLSPDEIAKL